MVDIAVLGVGADHEAGNPKPITVLIDGGRDHVVVEAAPVVPADEDRGRGPVGAVHGRRRPTRAGFPPPPPRGRSMTPPATFRSLRPCRSWQPTGCCRLGARS